MERPKRVKKPDFSEVIQFCEDYVSGIEKGELGEDDFGNLDANLAEAALTALYGDSIFDWISQEIEENDEDEEEEDMFDKPLEYRRSPDSPSAANFPSEAGFYWARENGHKFWNLIAYVEGRDPTFQVTSAWDYTHRRNIFPGFIHEFGPRIDDPEQPKSENKENKKC